MNYIVSFRHFRFGFAVLCIQLLRHILNTSFILLLQELWKSLYLKKLNEYAATLLNKRYAVTAYHCLENTGQITSLPDVRVRFVIHSFICHSFISCHHEKILNLTPRIWIQALCITKKYIVPGPPKLDAKCPHKAVRVKIPVEGTYLPNQ
jgi:hypothetical protein